MEVELKLFCHVCGEELDVDRKDAENGKVFIYPCNNCLDLSYQDGFITGREEGYDEGYEEGYTVGTEELW